MDPLLVISPHLDDAVLSVGQVLAGRPDCVVVTLFTGTPSRTRTLTSYDKNCGFRSARDAMTARRREDRAAMDLLAARSVHLGLLDHQYRGDGELPDEDAAADALAALADEHGVVQVVGPVGIAHPDHVIAARILAALLHRRPDLEGSVYEDLPARVLWPDEVPGALAGWVDMGFRPALSFLGTGPIEVKEQAIAAYKSQGWALDPHAVLCPERVHRLHRV